MTIKLLLCDCAQSQTIDAAAIEAATGVACSKVHSHLCTREIASLEAELAVPGQETVVACRQEREVFEDLAAERDLPQPGTIDIRDRAGWSDEGDRAAAKMAALIAAAKLAVPPTRTIDITSQGLCLMIGAGDTVLDAARQLEDTLAVTCLLSDAAPEILPGAHRGFDVARGRLRSVTGALGSFEVTVDAFAMAEPGGRGPLGFAQPRDGAVSQCDILLDLSGGRPLFSAHEKRDGYLRADPGDPLAVQRALLEASKLVGTFEKKLHVDVEASLCAHSRANQVGCTRCLDICPTGAIRPDGDAVAVDPLICAGCGSCSAVCPSAAISYASPPVASIMAMIRELAQTYRRAGGRNAGLLVHDAVHGREMIALAARLGRGLPAAVIPLEVEETGVFGHAEILVALTSGFDTVDILVGPRTEREVLARETTLAAALIEGLGLDAGRIGLVDVADPDALSDHLHERSAEPLGCEPILPLGRRRDVTRLAMRTLAGTHEPEPIVLPDGAPFGRVVLDDAACTLCLACASLCPSGALLDNPDRPELLFKEDACLQCGLCAGLCPESAIRLEPRFDVSDAALREHTLKREEPYECIRCAKPFGVKSTVERIVKKLESHSMFAGGAQLDLIRMCDDCRVQAQVHTENSPFKLGQPRKVRTTEDYLRDRDKS